MDLFKRNRSVPAAPSPSKEERIMRAMWELSTETGGGFVASLDICVRLGQDALSLGLSRTLESFESQGLIEHHRFEDGTGGDRPTRQGLARFNLV